MCIRDSLTGDNKEKRDEQLSVIVDETDRLSGLVNSVMELSKYSSGTEKLNPCLLYTSAGAAAFWGYLCYYDMAALYYASNYTFNLNLVQGFEMTRIVYFPPYMAVLMWL